MLEKKNVSVLEVGCGQVVEFWTPEIPRGSPKICLKGDSILLFATVTFLLPESGSDGWYLGNHLGLHRPHSESVSTSELDGLLTLYESKRNIQPH